MKLYLLRHAKSSWDDPYLADADRPLAPRGRRAAAAVRDHLAATGVRLDVVLCSPARRTRETWAAVADAVAGQPRLVIEPKLYGAGVTTLLGLVRSLPEDAGAALLVGHNPGFEELAQTLAAGGDPDALACLADGYPTGALAVFDIADPWPAVRSGYLAAFVKPRDLPGY